jgi:hypothetical protein
VRFRESRPVAGRPARSSPILGSIFHRPPEHVSRRSVRFREHRKSQPVAGRPARSSPILGSILPQTARARLEAVCALQGASKIATRRRKAGPFKSDSRLHLPQTARARLEAVCALQGIATRRRKAGPFQSDSRLHISHHSPPELVSRRSVRFREHRKSRPVAGRPARSSPILGSTSHTTDRPSAPLEVVCALQGIATRRRKAGQFKSDSRLHPSTDRPRSSQGGLCPSRASEFATRRQKAGPLPSAVLASLQSVPTGPAADPGPTTPYPPRATGAAPRTEEP